jgi:transcriptional regulator with XRE-family HTH domain
MVTTEYALQARVGALVRAARQQRHLTLVELARAAGVSASTISRIEHGHDTALSTVDRVLAAMELGLHMEPEPLWDTIDRDIEAAAGRSRSERIAQWDIDFTAFVTLFQRIPYVMDGLMAASLQGAPVPVGAFEVAVPRDDEVLDQLTDILRDMAARRWCAKWGEWTGVADPRDELDGPRWRCVHGEMLIRLVDRHEALLWVDFDELPLARGRIVSFATPPTPLTSARVPVVPLFEVETVDSHASRVLERMRGRPG